MAILPDLPEGDVTPRMREALEELFLDAIAVYRATLENGTMEDRLAVMKALPQMKALLGEQDRAVESVQSKALDYLASIADGWRAVTGSPRDDIAADDDGEW